MQNVTPIEPVEAKPTAEHEAGYDLFISYARNPDYQVARGLESFLESFHTLPGREKSEPLRKLSVCRDGGDFSLGARTRSRPGADPASMEHVIRPHLERSGKLLVLCSENSAKSPWVEAEIEWFLQSHGMEDVVLAVTEGDRPERTPQTYFPPSLVAAGRHVSGWYDLRAARAPRGHPFQDFDEARVQLAADLNGRSAGELFPVWQRDQRQLERRRRIFLTWTAVAISALLVLASWQFFRAAAARDAVSVQLAESLSDRAVRLSTPGPELDVVQAFHLAVRAAAVSPDGHPQTPLHVARVLHLAAGLPVRMVRLRDQQDELRYGVLSRGQRYLLGMTSRYEPAVWDLGTGVRMPVPFPRGSFVGESGDEVVGGPGNGMEFMEFSADGSMAKAVLNMELLWIWDVATGRLVDTVRVDYDDAPVFTRAGTAVVTPVHEPGGDPVCPLVRCGRVLWPRAGTPPIPAEDTIFPVPGGAEPTERKLLYRAGRPVLVATAADSYDGQLEQPQGEMWTVFGATDDDSLITAVSRQGRVYVWDARARPLVRDRAAVNRLNPLDTRVDSTGLLVLTATGGLVHLAWDGTETWSARLAHGGDTAGISWAALWPTRRPDQWLAAYRFGDADWGNGWTELWRVGDSQPHRQGPLRAGMISDVVLFDDDSTGLMELEGEEEYDNVESWSFAGSEAGRRKSVIGNRFGGMTRDGRVLLLGNELEVILEDAATGRRMGVPFRFGSGNGLGGSAAMAILRSAHGLQPTATGVRGALPSGKEVQLHRQAPGARLEVDGQPIRGYRSESLLALSPDGRMLMGLLAYRSAGGRVGPMRDLVVREAVTGRVIAAHHRLDAQEVLGFTPANHSVLVQDQKGRVEEMFVHGGHQRAPEWLEDLGVALTGTRLLPDLTLVEVSEQEQRQARVRVRGLLTAAAREDKGARFLLTHFFRGAD